MALLYLVKNRKSVEKKKSTHTSSTENSFATVSYCSGANNECDRFDGTNRSLRVA